MATTIQIVNQDEICNAIAQLSYAKQNYGIFNDLMVITDNPIFDNAEDFITPKSLTVKLKNDHAFTVPKASYVSIIEKKSKVKLIVISPSHQLKV